MLALFPLMVIVLSACSGSGPQSSLEPLGKFAEDIDGLWDLVLIVSTIVFILVFAAMVVAIFKFRERPNDARRPKQLHGNTKLEILWTIIPAVLLATIAVPTIQGIFDNRAVPEGPDVLQVDVIGHQWWWEFQYPAFVGRDGQPLTTANELHIPADTVVNLTMTSVDVIHSFWVPPLNGKRDVVPGRTHTLSLHAYEPTPPGEPIPGQCAEFCGLAHADMRVKVFVDSDQDFDAWVQGQLLPAEMPADGTLAAEGWTSFTSVCTACHQATVIDATGLVSVEGTRLAPNLTHFASRTTFAGAILESTAQHLAEWIDNPSDLKPMDPDRNDIAAGRILGMPDFNLNADEIAGLVAMLQGWE